MLPFALLLKLTRWFDKIKAGRAKVEKTALSVNSSLWLVSESLSYCQFATIESIQINDKSEIKIEADAEIEVGLKFDVDARKGLSLYVVPQKIKIK
ncbi:MAG: hypothetical protein WA865_05085 [Spirulinaceae cyanobacterium]